jgi:hypothetical protein
MRSDLITKPSQFIILILLFNFQLFLQIRKLEDQLRQTQAAKDELENGQKELQSMMKQLEESKNMEHQERSRLEDEIRQKQNEVHSIYEQVRNLQMYFIRSFILLTQRIEHDKMFLFFYNKCSAKFSSSLKCFIEK